MTTARRRQSLGIACLLTLCLLSPLDVHGQRPQYPLALAVEADGQTYLADRKLPGVWTFGGGEIGLFFEGSRKFRTPLNAVRCLALDAEGRLLAGDSATRQVYRLEADQAPLPLAQPISDNLGPLGIPMGLAVNPGGDIFVSDLEFHCIWKMPQDGGAPEKFAEIPAPIGLTFDGQGNLWVVSRVENPLRKIAADGTVEIVVKDRPFNFPHNVAVDEAGVAYVVDGFERCVWKVAPGEAPTKWFTHEKLLNPVDIKRHQSELLVIDPRANAMFRIQADGQASVHEF